MDDCLSDALAATGPDASIVGAVLIASVVLLVGAVMVASGRRRMAGIAIGLVALLAFAGVMSSETSPAIATSMSDELCDDSELSGDDVTAPTPTPTPTPTPVPDPVNLAPTLTLIPSIVSGTGTVSLRGRIFNLTPDADSGSPIVFRFTKLPIMSNLMVTTPGVTVDDTTDPDNYIFTYAGNIPANSPVIVEWTVLITAAAAQANNLWIVLETGTGNDSTPANNADAETLQTFLN